MRASRVVFGERCVCSFRQELVSKIEAVIATNEHLVHDEVVQRRPARRLRRCFRDRWTISPR